MCKANHVGFEVCGTLWMAGVEPTVDVPIWRLGSKPELQPQTLEFALIGGR